MAYSSRPYARRYLPSNRFPVGLKWLLIANTAIFVLWFFMATAGAGGFFRNFYLVPAQVVTTFALWQVVTYMFFHGGFMHILWNMLTLWMFGAELERMWGTRRFLRFYFACGIGAALTVILVTYTFGADPNVATIGASGAIYGILMAYAILFPDRLILFGFLIPIKVKYFVMIMGAVVFMNSFVSFGSGVSQVAHLGGLAVAFFMLRGRWLQRKIQAPIVREFKEWKLRRARKKFEVYLRKQDSKTNRWTH
jgi:membrane associated rhomboid family serine protease